MIQPASLEELASLVEKDGKKVFLFVADWCGDCRYIYPALPEIEKTNPEFTFIPMKYYSTNKQAPVASLQEAVVKGLAADKGLFMPKIGRAHV